MHSDNDDENSIEWQLNVQTSCVFDAENLLFELQLAVGIRREKSVAMKTKEQFIVWKARFDLFESFDGTTQLTHIFFHKKRDML